MIATGFSSREWILSVSNIQSFFKSLDEELQVFEKNMFSSIIEKQLLLRY